MLTDTLRKLSLSFYRALVIHTRSIAIVSV